MNASVLAVRLPRRGSALGAIAGGLAIAVLGLAADPAAASFSAQVQAGTLTITGNGASDNLVLTPGSPNTLVLDVGGDGTADFTFDRDTFTAVDIKAGGGDDEVRIGNGLQDEAISVDGGGGADTLLGGNGAETFVGGSGNDFVDGNIGADVADLGSGADRFQWDPGDGSDTVEGDAGNDVLDFNGSNAAELIDVSANGERVRLTRNVGTITMDLNEIEGLNVRALGAADTVTVNDLTGTDLDTADVDLNATGGGDDGQPDTVIAAGTDQSDSAEVGSADGRVVVEGLGAETRVAGGQAGDNVNVETLGGEDAISSGVNLVGAAAVNVNGGDGADTATYEGTPGDDTIGIAPNGAAAATFAPGTAVFNTTAVEDLDVLGRAGADTIAGSNGLATRTRLTLDGGQGDDSLRGGDGADVLLGGGGADFVDGNIGADLAELGAGADRFQWDPGDGSDVVEGQGGKDVMDFNGSNVSELMDVSANGHRVRLTRNVGTITMDLNDVEGLTIRALGGADTITVNDLSGTDLDNADIDLGAVGGGGDGERDTVVENGTEKADVVRVTRVLGQVESKGLAAELRIDGSEPENDTLQVRTLGGDDRVTVAPDVSGLITPVVDLGADE
jgi:RTX calcium-binding nonapeptide repeat (4 copies)